MTLDSTIDDHARFSNRTRLTLFLVPISAVFIGAQVARAIWPTLLTEAPWSLLVLSSNTTRMLLVEPLVPIAVFFSVAIARPLVLAPLYYCFGRSYGNAALRWAERKLGSNSKLVPASERIFKRFSFFLVAWSPHLFVCVMAGATVMRFRVFYALAIVGTVVKVTIVYFLGDALREPLEDFADFVGKYQWYITPITFAIVAMQLWRRKTRDELPIESVDEFEQELEEAATEPGP